MHRVEDFTDLQSLNQPGLESVQPKYEQLRGYVIAQIESGQFKAGAALLSEHRIAQALQIARSTVRQAMSTLEREGLVRRVHGKGTFVHEQARQRLRRGQDIFALILPETETGFYPSLQKSFEEAAARLHNQVIVCNSGNEIGRQGNSILQLIDLQVAGVAVVPTTNPLTPAFQLRQLQSRGMPVVCCSRRVEGVKTPLLAIPFEEVGRLAGRVIREYGHRHVAFYAMDHTESVRINERGFRSGLGHGVEVLAIHGDCSSPDVSQHEAAAVENVNRLLSAPHPPTAIYCTFDSLAELLYVLLNRKGLRVPEDVSLVGFGGARRKGALQQQLTSVTIDEHQLGSDAINLLNRMRNGELPIESTKTDNISLGLSRGRTLQQRPDAKQMYT